MNPQSILHNITTYPVTQKCVSKTITQVMISRHTCPCCCSTLLRHARTGEIYWRCSSCYQEMPV